MNQDDFKSLISNVISSQEPINAEIYFILAKSQNYEVVFADIESSTQKELCAIFAKKIKETIEGTIDSIPDITSLDSRRYSFCRYDLDELPHRLAVVKSSLTTSLRKFDFKKDKYPDIFGYLVKIGTQEHNFTIFRKSYPISIVSQDKNISLERFGDSSRLIKVKKDFLKISPGIDILVLNNELFIKDLGLLERFFDFHEVVKNKAKILIDKLFDSGLIIKDDGFLTSINNPTFARKVVRTMSANRIIGSIHNDDIFGYAKNHPVFSAHLKFDEVQKKIVANTIKSREWLLKLINDEILISELTKAIYDVSAKDTITPGVEDGE